MKRILLERGIPRRYTRQVFQKAQLTRSRGERRMEGDPGTQLCVQSEQPHRINISLPAAGAPLLHALETSSRP
ncbi:hypothetical protein BK144_12600 [Paenibacillus sp. FSL R7-0273]|nr:hypothetical protein BK144_12600 [Paenibacillus sp. FSL R7-0273]